MYYNNTENHQVIITDTAIFLAGTKIIEGELISHGIRVQRRRLRDSLKRVDPVGRRLRAMDSCIQRRVYNVRSPLALWHMDGNHKLIRFEVSKLYNNHALVNNILFTVVLLI